MALSNITLSAAVRQNLLSLQSTADLLATTQNALATGKKVNSALDNPTNFFTASGLDARASDISNLLDSIGNGVQVLQAANTGITSLSSLVDTAKSIANQVLQQPSGFSTKASITSTTPVAGTAGSAPDLINSGTPNTLSGETFIFKTPPTAPVPLTANATAGATNFNSITTLNTELAANNINLIASFNSNGSIAFPSTNDAASQTITSGGAFVAPTAGHTTSVDVSGTGAVAGSIVPPATDPVSQATRANLVGQFNQILTQINTTAQDAS